METVEQVAHLDLILLGENFATIEVFVGVYLVVGQQSHDYAEEVFLSVDIFFGEVQRRVFVLIEVQLTVYYAHPLAVGVSDVFSGVFIECLLSLSHLRAGGFTLSVACARS